MNSLFVLFFLVFISSCAKLGYIYDQSVGQLSLQWNSIPNEELINSDKITQQQKEKLILIEKYKQFFFDYFKLAPTKIYRETTLLKSDAVTYLLIASPSDYVQAKEFSFPFVGSFPYIGFFSKDSAHSWAQDLKAEGNSTYIRPVYAYSTLGYFEDRVLSSFFFYEERELAELIFHELFHTIFFVEDDVEFNENLAQYFGMLLTFEYFNYSQIQKTQYLKKLESENSLNDFVVESVKLLNLKYLNTQNNHHEVLKAYVKEQFLPKLKEKCKDVGISPCYLAQGEWNNARFAAFVSYHGMGQNIKELRDHWENPSLVEFYRKIENTYKRYKEADVDELFSSYLFKEIKK